MNLLVLGATGPTGRHVVNQALAAGHQVTALARNPTALSPAGGLRVVTGNALDAQAVHAAAEGAEAVVCALGARARSDAQVCSRATAHLVAAMKAHRTRHAVVCTSLGVGDSRPDAPWLFMRVLVPLFLREAFADKERQEEVLRDSGMPFTLARPGGLTDGPATGRVFAAPRMDRTAAVSRIARADVAAWMLAEAMNPAHTGKAMVLGTLR